MKELILLAVVSMTCSLSFAAPSFRPIKAKICDGVQQPLGQQERFLFDAGSSLLSFSAADASGCAAADFYAVMITARGAINGSSVYHVTPVSAVGRKDCRGNMQPGSPIFFESAEISAEQVVLNRAGSCRQVVLRF